MSETFPLSRPIKIDGEEVTELTLLDDLPVTALEGTRLRVNGDGGIDIEYEQVFKVFRKAANIPPSAAKQISSRDYMRMVAVAMDFLGGSPPTGETFSETSPGSTTGRRLN